MTHPSLIWRPARPRVLDLFCCADGGKATVAEMQAAMGITWTDVREELTEAIPPAYTEWIGRAFLASRVREAAA